MRILVTGAAGFIGSALTLRLLERGDTVHGIDNLNDYYDVAHKKAYLERLTTREKFIFELLDIAQQAGMEALFKRLKFDVFVTLAAQADVVIQPENAVALAEAVTALAESPERTAVMARRGRRFVEVELDRNKLAAAMSVGMLEGAVSELLDGKVPKGRVPEFWDGKSARRVVDSHT